MTVAQISSQDLVGKTRSKRWEVVVVLGDTGDGPQHGPVALYGNSIPALTK